MSIAANIEEVQGRIARACERSHRSPAEITLVVVTKEVGISVIRTAFDCGIRDFGENRVQEAEDPVKYRAGVRT